MAVTNQEKYVNQGEKIAQQGDDAWKTGAYDTAKNRYGEAVDFFHAQGDVWGEAQVLVRWGELALSLEDFDLAHKLFSSAIELVENEPDAETVLADACIKTAKVYIAQYELDKALAYVKKAENVLNRGGSPILLGDAYDHEAYIYLMLNRENDALQAYRKAADLFEQDRNSLKEASTLRAIARIEMKNKNYDVAHDLLEKCRNLYRENGDLLGEASALSAIGCLRYIIRDIANARKALMKSVYLYGKVSHHFAEAESLLYLARVEAYDREQGDFDRARAHYKRSIELFDFLGNEDMKKAVLDEYYNFLNRIMAN